MTGGPLMDAGFGTYGVLILLCAVMSYAHARSDRYDQHRAWTVRLFALAGGSSLCRMEYAGGVLVSGGVGMGPGFTGWFDTVMMFFFYAPKLIVAEIFIRGRRRDTGVIASAGVATVFLAASVFIIIATGSFTARSWGPRIISGVSDPSRQAFQAGPYQRPDFDDARSCATLVLTTPGSSVKEQIGAVYARRMAESGFVAPLTAARRQKCRASPSRISGKRSTSSGRRPTAIPTHQTRSSSGATPTFSSLTPSTSYRTPDAAASGDRAGRRGATAPDRDGERLFGLRQPPARISVPSDRPLCLLQALVATGRPATPG